MIKWLALRRYNYIDATFNAMCVVAIVKQWYVAALIGFIVGVLLSVYIEGKARNG